MSAPTIEVPRSLPERRHRARRGGPVVETLSVKLALVTPVLGGAAVPRTIDEVDIVRVPSIRGQLRFWWRALRAHEFGSPRDLWKEESKLFGRAADEADGRSPVELRVQVEQREQIEPVEAVDRSDIELNRTPGAYALFVAARQRKGKPDEVPPAPRRLPETVFTLGLRAPADRLEELRNVLRAWILFGGYGSRTRRGLGSFTLHSVERNDKQEDLVEWLPSEASLAELERVLGRDVFAPASRPATETPRLRGASLLVGQPVQNAEAAWTTALGWLRDFRQGTRGETGERAREPGAGGRPSVSNWPEADKIRHLTGKRNSHRPRYGPDPAWPRAGFGLPIVGQFQTRGRNNERYDEPGPYEVNWRQGNESRNRLASPLIVKAMPLADKKFVPIALWLERAFPARGLVVLRMGGKGGKEVPGSAVPFDKLLGKGDQALFAPLAGETSLRAAFLDWLTAQSNVRKIA